MNTLGLNMIVGANEAGELRRCLDSIRARETFDEIIIVLTSGDSETEQAAREYTDKIYHREWCSEKYPYGDFAGARNVALDNSTADFIMWLDCDDAFHCKKSDKSLSKMIDLIRNCDKSIDAFFIEYSLIVTEDFTPIVSFLKERIFRRKRGLRWRYPVHELLRDRWDGTKNAVINGVHVVHMSEKTQYASASRNVKILEHEYKQGDRCLHTKYFMARDMMILGRFEEAMSIFNSIVQELSATPENLHSICTEMIFYLAYGKVKMMPMLGEMSIENIAQVEKWIRLDIAFCDKYAEPYCLLGDVYLSRGMFSDAERMYTVALRKQYGTGMMQILPFYNLIPLQRLSSIYSHDGLFEKSLAVNKQALQNCQKHSNGMYEQLISQRNELIELIKNEVI